MQDTVALKDWFSLLTDFDLVLSHPGQCLHRLVGVSPLRFETWVGDILGCVGVVAVAECLLGLPGCLGHSHVERFCYWRGVALERMEIVEGCKQNKKRVGFFLCNSMGVFIQQPLRLPSSSHRH